MNIYRIKADGKGINAIKPSNHGKGTCLHLGGTGKGRSVGDLLLFIFSPVCVKVHLPEKNGHWLEKNNQYFTAQPSCGATSWSPFVIMHKLERKCNISEVQKKN